MKIRKQIDFQKYLLDKLKDTELALAYLNEALVDKNKSIFLLALKDILEAQRGT